MRIFVKYIYSDTRVEYFTISLNKAKHHMQKDSFMQEVIDKVLSTQVKRESD
jgi:hypothetical protein